MPIVIPAPTLPPLEPPKEDGSSLWELLYEAMGFHRETDEENAFALRRFCEAWCEPLQRVYDLVRERDGQAGWAIALDPENCPPEALPYLAQYVGAILTPNMDLVQQRAEIKEPSGWSRGRVPAIKLAARRELTGTELVIVRERKPEPGYLYVRTLLSEDADPVRTEATVRSQTPAWLALDFEALEGVTWADVTSGWEDWAAVSAAFESWADLTDILPEELPP